jgi:hypothetical protein
MATDTEVETSLPLVHTFVIEAGDDGRSRRPIDERKTR